MAPPRRRRRGRRPPPLPLPAALVLVILLASSAIYHRHPPRAAAETTSPEEEPKEEEEEREEGGGKRRRRILSFGGNGMIGSAVLSRLIDPGGGGGGGGEVGYEIDLVSRGSWPYDSSDRIRPHVNSYVCDRSDRFGPCPEGDGGYEEECEFNALYGCDGLIERMGRVASSGGYHAVLDFSAYTGEWVDDALDALLADVGAGGGGDPPRVYVYVSTDSVYEVSGGYGYAVTGRKTTEGEAIRPDDEYERRRLISMDEYGDRKLSGEEVLERWRRGGGDDEDEGGARRRGVPYVSLRFADILGPRDGTDRYVTYHIWARYAGRVPGVPPLSVPDDVIEGTSVTFVEDAADAIIAAMGDPGSWDNAYNVACEEVFNVTDALLELGRIMHGKEWDGGVIRLPPQESFSLFPSVRRGPIDVSRARQELGFVPTPLADVLRRTAEWYDAALLGDDGKVRRDMVDEFVGDVLDDLEGGTEVAARVQAAAKGDASKAAWEHRGEEEL